MSSAAEARILLANEISVHKTDGGFLALRIGDEEHARVHLYWCFPFSHHGRYVSVRDPEGEEIGIIEDLEGFDEDTLRLLVDELASRYFTPTISRIVSLKEEFGYAYWEVDTDAGQCRFTAQIGKNAVTVLDGSRLLINDVDGNRFEYPDYDRSDPKYLRVIENLL